MSILLLLILGLAVGVVSGTLGIGGGILLVPALMWLTGIEDQKRAAGISLVIITAVNGVGTALNTTFGTMSTQLK